MVWMQYAVDTVCSGCSGIVVYGGEDIVFGAKRSNQWMQYTLDTVHSGCSGIVVYGGGDIVFDTKRSNQWMQWMHYAACSGCSGIVVYGVGTLSLVQKGQTSGCSGYSTQWMQWNSGIWWWGHCLCYKKVKPLFHCVLQTFLHQRQCPHPHIPLLLHPLV